MKKKKMPVKMVRVYDKLRQRVCYVNPDVAASDLLFNERYQIIK